jgi:hypothetical protein
MTTDPRTRLIALLMRLDAVDLAEKVWLVRDVRELPADVRGQMLDVLGHHAAERGFNRDGTPNQLGRDLDELAEALGLDPDLPPAWPMPEPTGYVSVIALALLRSVMVELQELEEADAVPPNDFQTNPGENGHSLAIAMLGAVVIESAINHVRLVRHHSVRPRGRREHVVTYLARMRGARELTRDVEEVFAVRDAIVHAHQYIGAFTWDDAVGFRTVRRPRLRRGYGDDRLRAVVRDGSPHTRRLGLNLMPTRVWRRDAYLVLQTVFRLVGYLETRNRRFIYVSPLAFVLGRHVRRWEEVVAHVNDRLAALDARRWMKTSTPVSCGYEGPPGSDGRVGPSCARRQGRAR